MRPHQKIFRTRTRTRGKINTENTNMIKKLLKGDFLNGKKTFISLLLGLAGFAANKYGVKHEFEGIVEIVSLNSAELVTLAGLIGAVWGRLVAKPKD